MSISFKDFLTCAREMAASEGASEVVYRNAMSRGYYAVYHAACETATRLSLPEYSGHAHEQLAFRYQNAGHKALAYRMRDLHRQRCKADYECDISIGMAHAQKALLDCQRVIEELTSLPTN